MKFSIIIPAHNEERAIGRCLSSLLEQKYKNYEIIVINDGSTDRTKEIVKTFQRKSKKIRLLSFKKGHSAAFARNRGAEIAKGDVFVFIDADQFVKKDFLNKINKDFKEKSIDGIICKILGASKTFIGRCYAARKWLFWLTRQTRKQILINSNISISAIKKQSFFEVGKYDESLFYREDRYFSQKVIKNYKVLLDPLIIIYHYDPASWNEMIRHAKWVGRGLATDIKKFGWKLESVKNLGEIFFWPLFSVIVILSVFFQSFRPFLSIIFFPLFYALKTSIYSKDFIHSFGFLFLSIPKGFISSFTFIIEMCRKI